SHNPVKEEPNGTRCEHSLDRGRRDPRLRGQHERFGRGHPDGRLDLADRRDHRRRAVDDLLVELGRPRLLGRTPPRRVRRGSTSARLLDLAEPDSPEAAARPLRCVWNHTGPVTRQIMTAARSEASARDADRLTDEFVSIASHELRAPIAVVHGIAATLAARLDELRGEQVHALLAQLVVQTDRLRDLADQLLDLSQIESGAAAGPAERFDPGTRLEGLVPRIAGDCAADVHLLVESGRTIVADPVAFE